jgi:hypothetical protein
MKRATAAGSFTVELRQERIERFVGRDRDHVPVIRIEHGACESRRCTSSFAIGSLL